MSTYTFSPPTLILSLSKEQDYFNQSLINSVYIDSDYVNLLFLD